LTTAYNSGAFPCTCDSDGSLSHECDPYGGQCQCRPHVIGRRCDACKTGYFGFPDCKSCDCPSAATCETATGECICPPRVVGKDCDQCEPMTYGFDPIIGCEECKCNYFGAEDGNLQCDLFNGSCELVGRLGGVRPSRFRCLTNAFFLSFEIIIVRLSSRYNYCRRRFPQLKQFICFTKSKTNRCFLVNHR